MAGSRASNAAAVSACRRLSASTCARVAHPTPEDVLLAIEVADTTARFDRILKARLYARARITEYWLVDVGNERVDVFRSSSGEAYADTSPVGRGGRVVPLTFPDVAITIADLFA